MNKTWALLGSIFLAFASMWFSGLFSGNLLPSIPKSSSIWCVRHLSGNKICHLRHIIYNSSSVSFDFVLDSESIISGVNSYKDLQKLQLSSLIDHNRFYANLSTTMTPSQCSNIKGSVVAIARFKPDNLMHVIHDDLMPLFVTLEHLCRSDLDDCKEEHSLLLLDGNIEGPFSSLYTLFSSNVILSSSIDECLAVSDLHIGLNLDTIWYQYGFKSPRGGISTILSAETLWRFRKFMLRKLLVEDKPQELKVVVLKRTFSRRILNFGDIVRTVKLAYGQYVTCKVVEVRLNNTQELVEEIVNAKLLIGVHGAEMILTLFLPSNSIVIEIMPHGIPNSVSFLAPLKNISHFQYIQWTAEEDGVRHPEYPAHLGGLKHLPREEQARIANIKSIHEVRCCDDPTFLHLMYQDTRIGKSFEDAVVKSKIPQGNRFLNLSSISKWFYPGHVQNLQCRIMDSNVLLSWSPPSNAFGREQFSVVLVLGGRNFAFMVPELSLRVEERVSTGSAWVSAVFYNNKGPDSFVACSRV